MVRSIGFLRRLLHAKRNDPCSISDKLPNGYQSLLVVMVVAVMANYYHMMVVTVMAVMAIWLRKSAGCKEHEQDKH